MHILLQSPQSIQSWCRTWWRPGCQSLSPKLPPPVQVDDQPDIPKQSTRKWNVSRRFVRKTFYQDRFMQHFFQANPLRRFSGPPLPLDPLGSSRPIPWPPETQQTYQFSPWDTVGIPLDPLRPSIVQEVSKYWQSSAQVLPKLRQSIVQVVPSIDKEAPNYCPGSAQMVHKYCPGSAQIVSKCCPRIKNEQK